MVVISKQAFPLKALERHKDKAEGDPVWPAIATNQGNFWYWFFTFIISQR